MLRLMQAELQGIKWVDKSSVCLTYFMRMMFSYSTNGAERSLRNLMHLMKVYEKSSGQLVNAAESGFYIAEKFQHRESIISRVTKMARGEIPFNYLGVPLFAGRVKNIYFDHVIDKVRRAVDGWKAKLLSFGGRLTLIKSMHASELPHLYYG